MPDFVTAADMACRVVQAFLAKTQDFEAQKSLQEGAKKALSELMAGNRDHDENNRLAVVHAKVAAGPGIQEVVPPYIPKSPGSWKALATGIEAVHGDGDGPPQWTPTFETVDYRRFHDAVKEHRFVVTQQILPAAAVRLA